LTISSQKLLFKDPFYFIFNFFHRKTLILKGKISFLTFILVGPAAQPKKCQLKANVDRYSSSAQAFFCANSTIFDGLAQIFLASCGT